ncbi:MAG: hypothetical protein K2Q34_06355 [Alphaproteobacteria bacterium]|nr:hypothetical protein [Alphaproteobacteria bacterium]
MNKWVYVPYQDQKMDEYANALIEAKKGKYELILRTAPNVTIKNLNFSSHSRKEKEVEDEKKEAMATELNGIKSGDRLYILLDGTMERGEGGYTTLEINKNRKEKDDPYGFKKIVPATKKVDAETLADDLIKSGLPNSLIDLRLWTCYGGENIDAGTEAEQMDSSFGCRLHAAFNGHGYIHISVTAYKALVSIASIEDARNPLFKDGKKRLNMGSENEPNFVKTSSNLREYPFKAQFASENVRASLQAKQVKVQGKKTSSGGCCFISTAVCQSLGLDEFCNELNILRWFRDAIMTTLENGKTEIDYYYKIAPQIVKCIEKEKEPKRIYEKIYKIYLKKSIKSILEKNYIEAYQKYKQMVFFLKDKYHL